MDLRSIQYLYPEDSTCWSGKHLLDMCALRFNWKLAPSQETVALLNSSHTVGFLFGFFFSKS